MVVLNVGYSVACPGEIPELKCLIHLFIYFSILLTVNAAQLVDITVLAMSRQENVCALLDTLEIHVKKES